MSECEHSWHMVVEDRSEKIVQESPDLTYMDLSFRLRWECLKCLTLVDEAP